LLTVDCISFDVRQGEGFGFLGPLLFVGGIFILLGEMGLWARILACLSPLTYAQDLMNHAVLGTGYLKRWLDVALLPVLLVFLIPAAQLHHRSRVLGY
jgi:ABC-type multidrug transport system permease subunit